ncbi:uncharacterized protein LOC132702295 [Cylas formicarius]|uniref:uncharacterized protein LOC132702295 n=1 Tax=Cylas formicarius TaxID=197179 RepID=UPI0029588DE5|nr:uncharacterized protein LOC132702295 [Cylas formicarius]XP_060526827.1 uncharacterized protein LOC132702295 [Cylas formicarius]
MLWSTLKWVVLGVIVAVLGGDVGNAAPSPRSEDMFRELMKLDQLYSSVARPSVRSVPMSSDVGPKVQRALNMLRLQELDRLYADRARPRFGKRGDGVGRNNMIPVEYDNQYRGDQEVDDWLPARR